MVAHLAAGWLGVLDHLDFGALSGWFGFNVVRQMGLHFGDWRSNVLRELEAFIAGQSLDSFLELLVSLVSGGGQSLGATEVVFDDLGDLLNTLAVLDFQSVGNASPKGVNTVKEVTSELLQQVLAMSLAPSILVLWVVEV